MRDVRHLLHVVLIFAAAAGGFLFVRGRLVPETFGKYGHYRAAAVDEIAAQQPRYAGEKACGKCHAQQAADKAKSSHRNMACESCHGALLAHAADPKNASDRPFRPKQEEMRAFCGRCHGKSLSRPARFPQVDLAAHNPDAPCSMCHQPHQPK